MEKNALIADHSSLLSCIIPFKSFSILESNLLPSLSALNQDCEIIFVHDSQSSILESELNLLTSIPAKVKYYNGKFGNAGMARNVGLENANGDWIVFWDSDDKVFPAEVLSIINKISQARTFITQFSVVNKFNESETLLKRITNGSIVANPGIWRFIFPSNFVKSIRFPNILVGEDLCFLISAKIFDRPFEKIEVQTYEYRLSKFQTTYKLESIQLSKLAIEQLRNDLEKAQSRSCIAFGIYFRQLNSLFLKSRGKEIRFIVSRFIRLLIKLKPFQLSSFAVGFCISFKRGIV